MNNELEFYATPGPMTDLSICDPLLFEGLPGTPVDLMKVVRGCVTSTDLLTTIHKVTVPEGRGHEAGIRPAAAIVARIGELDPSPLTVVREPQRRIIGNCRTFATLSCALIRRTGTPARVRAGFAGYFQPNVWADHWIIEYWDARWVRVDPELDDGWLAKNAGGVTSEALATKMYRSGAESWLACRTGELDANRFNMGGTNWGIGEIRGSVAYDFAALNQDEMLPWDVWGRMEDAYKGRTGDDYDAHLDAVSEIVIGGDFDAVRKSYLADDVLRVPGQMAGTA